MGWFDMFGIVKPKDIEYKKEDDASALRMQKYEKMFDDMLAKRKDEHEKNLEHYNRTKPEKHWMPYIVVSEDSYGRKWIDYEDYSFCVEYIESISVKEAGSGIPEFYEGRKDSWLLSRDAYNSPIHLDIPHAYYNKGEVEVVSLSGLNTVIECHCECTDILYNELIKAWRNNR